MIKDEVVEKTTVIVVSDQNYILPEYISVLKKSEGKSDSNYDLICNLSNYKDEILYIESVNSFIL